MEFQKVVGIGEVLWDILPEGKRPGGAPANFAYHVSQFGLPVCVVSAVGDDDLGRALVGYLAEKRIDTLIETVGFPTGTVQVAVDAAGIPSYEIKEGVAWDNIRFTPELEALARQTCAVCFGSLAQRHPASMEAVCRFLDAMPGDGGALVVFDANLRQNYYDKETLCYSMRRCNVLKINDEELPVVAKMSGVQAVSDAEMCRDLLKRYDLKMLILTCGVAGSYVYTADGVSFRSTPKVEIADTVGAGDSFTAAFIASLLLGKSVGEAHEAAVRISAYVCTQKGAMPRLPEEIRRDLCRSVET